jgi:hypothetical protein
MAVSRRALLGSVAAGLCGARLETSATDGGAPERRRAQAFETRLEAARAQRRHPLPEHKANGDEARFGPSRIASYSKGLPHNALGEVDPHAYASLVAALSSGSHEDLELVPMGCANPRRLVNPQAGLAFDLEGADSHHLAIPPAPAFTSAEQAAELVELYWMALLRDVPFAQYATNADAHAAAADLSRLSGFAGGQVTPATLFRGLSPGDLEGPYVSQFLLRPVPFGAQMIEPRLRTLLPGVDHMIDYEEWLAIQNGCEPTTADRFDSARPFIRNSRDLAQWVHVDVLYQAGLDAMLILLIPPDASDEITGGGLGAPLNPGNPYNHSRTQAGFGTFGAPAIATLVAEVATRALTDRHFLLQR